jgi:hypothetical protein
VEHLKRRRQGEEREQYKWVVLTRPGTLYHPPTPHALRDGCTRTIAPARARAAEPLALERTLSDLVNLTCGLGCAGNSSSRLWVLTKRDLTVCINWALWKSFKSDSISWRDDAICSRASFKEASAAFNRSSPAAFSSKRGTGGTAHPAAVSSSPTAPCENSQGKSRNWESRKQVRSEKSCVTGGESPSSLEAELPEFRTKVMNGKV